MIPVEVASPGSQAIPQSISEPLSESVSDSVLSLAAQYCPNLNRQQLEACCRSILRSRRAVIEPSATTASVLDLARRLKGPSVVLGRGFALELAPQDPVRSSVPQAQADQDYTALVSCHLTKDSQVVARVVETMLESQGELRIRYQFS
jgi:hypothetical protein